MDMTRKRAQALLAIALGVTAAGVVFVLRGGFGLGFFLALAAMEAALLLFLAPEAKTRLAALPSGRRAARRLLIYALAAVILMLAAAFAIFHNEPLQALNTLALLVLYPVQLMLVSESSAFDWDHPGFWLESALSYAVRPFISLGALPGLVRKAFGTDPARHVTGDAGPDSAAADGQARRSGWLAHVGMALIGLLCAIPVLLIAGALLSSADSVFGRLLESVARFWQTVTLRDWIGSLALTLVLFPFVFSFLESARSRWQAIGRPYAPAAIAAGTPAETGVAGISAGAARPRAFTVNPVMLVSFLASINLLYLAFSLVQLTYLTGAFSLSLPSGLSYAEYARSGFFELAGMALLNAGLIVLAVKGAPRAGAIGHILRAMSLLLVAGSIVQWGSAMFRMNMYVSVYGLTRLRFFVTAFMLLMAVIFGLLTVKEFRPGFPLFKAAAVAAVLALLLLNYVNSDAWIARHNLQRAIANPTVSLDLNYFRELSPDGVLVLADRLPELTAGQRQEAVAFLTTEFREVRQRNPGGPFRRWQDWNWSSWRLWQKLTAVLAPYL